MHTTVTVKNACIPMKTKKESWSCNICGATTTDEEHQLITYSHMNCPGKPLTMKARKIVEKQRLNKF